MKWEMDILSSSSHISNPTWLIQDAMNTTKWTPSENKLFENALAVYDKDTPDRWVKVAAMIPGKTVGDVIKQYRELVEDVSNIEAGLIPIPGYNSSTTTSQFTLDWVNSSGFDNFKSHGGKRSSSGRPPEQERKKGVPWTEEEHKLFLLGLKKYGKGDWRNISRNFVGTRTPTQVASHAQKYFIRQLSGGKDKRRASIHDITTVNLSETTRTPSCSSLEDNKNNSSKNGCNTKQEANPSTTLGQAHFQWNQANSGGGTMGFNPYGVNSYGMKMQGQNLHRSDLFNNHDSSYFGPQTQNMVFPMHSSAHYFSHAL
ncbi:transcription factor DIVARICATA-like [Neltuma alba]|uniref:transcription factor DIVARICATA-like n=1 Tax=Neltuma alba TaxID=207710 RepID=UPI0010A39345|nr:transcription factor DIVARICATA-like [Prosopis alba]XP_028792621.1 transcription factor DIVARICATA-like [Prosopis alba]